MSSLYCAGPGIILKWSLRREQDPTTTVSSRHPPFSPPPPPPAAPAGRARWFAALWAGGWVTQDALLCHEMPLEPSLDSFRSSCYLWNSNFLRENHLSSPLSSAKWGGWPLPHLWNLHVTVGCKYFDCQLLNTQCCPLCWRFFQPFLQQFQLC